MSGWTTNGVPQLGPNTGNELVGLDTEKASGQAPQSASISLQQLAVALAKLSNAASHATVAGTRYFVNFQLGSATQLTGIEVLIGATGGTDKWIVELHDSLGNLLATSATAGTTVNATANSWQQFAFTSPFNAPAGSYFLALQSNGTTATFAALNAPLSAQSSVMTGSAAGVFGTGAAITPPTTYAANTGPVAQAYV